MRTHIEECRYKELCGLSSGRNLTPEENEEWNRLHTMLHAQEEDRIQEKEKRETELKGESNRGPTYEELKARVAELEAKQKREAEIAKRMIERPQAQNITPVERPQTQTVAPVQTATPVRNEATAVFAFLGALAVVVGLCVVAESGPWGFAFVVVGVVALLTLTTKTFG